MKKICFLLISLSFVCSCGTTRNAATGSVVQADPELVNLGYGYTTKEMSSFSNKKVKLEDIPAMSYTSIADFLKGRAPGVKIIDNGMGEEPTVIIRGINTITGDTKPLYILDGVEISSLLQLNPNDIHSVEVMTDAGATIYGSRAGNGVLIFESKAQHNQIQNEMEQRRKERLEKKTARAKSR